ncbi:hypothetical protein BS78_07G113600 [Paspalum vaginatum]|nr:hypothetical protein BS78_07G113600 [Paspalum vaginatum]
MAPFSLHLLMVPLPAPLLHPRLLHGRQQQSCWPALPSSARRLLLPAGHPLLSLHLPSLASSLCSLLYMQQQLGQDDTVTLFPRSAAPIPCSSLPAALTHNQQHLLHLFLLYVQQQETAAAALRLLHLSLLTLIDMQFQDSRRNHELVIQFDYVHLCIIMPIVRCAFLRKILLIFAAYVCPVLWDHLCL